MEHPEKLFGLVKYEASVINHLIDRSKRIVVTVHYNDVKPKFTRENLSNVRIEIENAGLRFYFPMDLQFRHQIGIRLWRNKLLADIEWEWLEIANKNFSLIKDKVKQAFEHNDMVIRYHPSEYHSKLNAYCVYGIVSTFYTPSNQIYFRETFIEISQKTDILDTSFSITTQRKSKTVEETFEFDSEACKIDTKCSLIYGRNNGYRSYRVRWNRRSKDGLWLTPWESTDNYQWKNNAKSEISDFVNYLINEGREHQKFLNQRVELAEDTYLEDDFIQFFVERMILAYATKDRIMNQYKIQTQNFGKSVWALSSALRFIGTKDPHITKATKWFLLESGTLVFEKKYEEYLQAKFKIGLIGNYAIYESE